MVESDWRFLDLVVRIPGHTSIDKTAESREISGISVGGSPHSSLPKNFSCETVTNVQNQNNIGASQLEEIQKIVTVALKRRALHCRFA
jgi:hypothetical protein